MRVAKLWVWLAEDATNPPYTEGMCGLIGPQGGQMMTNTERMIPLLDAMAQRIADETGKVIRRVEFQRTDFGVREIKPRPQG